jgi:hypothetical protein
LEWAVYHAKRWHDIGKLPEALKAAELLEKRGVIEIRRGRYMLMKASDGGVETLDHGAHAPRGPETDRLVERTPSLRESFEYIYKRRIEATITT